MTGSADKRPQLHATALSMQCGEAFRRRYIEGEIIPPGVAAIVGRATDEAVTRNLEHKMRTRELLSIEEIAETARDGLNQEWEKGVTFQPEEALVGPEKVKGEAVDKAVRLAVLHAKVRAPAIAPTHVQRKWTIELRGYPLDLVGKLDIQEGQETIRDTKTTSKAPATDAAEKSLQLTSYHLAAKVIDGHAPAKVALDFLIDTQSPRAMTLEATRDDDDYRPLLRRIETLTLAIEKGVFLPLNPDHWACSERFCGYARTCKYFVRRPKQFAI